MSKESIILKGIVIMALVIMIALTPEAHATQVGAVSFAVAMEGTRHALH
jgi:hypothetical protein